MSADLDQLVISDREKVRELLGKTKDEVDKDIDIILKWFKSQKHLPETLSRNAIERVLVNTKFSIERTKSVCDMYYTARRLIPEVFKNCHPKLPEQKIYMDELLYYFPLPKTTKDYDRVVILKLRDVEFSAYSPLRVFTHIHMIVEVLLQEELSGGVIAIIDFKDIKKCHVLNTRLTQAKVSKFLAEKVWVNRPKGIHFVNVPSFAEILISFTKLVMKSKILERIYIHDSFEKIYEYVPKEILPSDYGGDEKSLEELNELWKLKFEKYEPHFSHLLGLQINESLRAEPLENSEMLGFYGNFKKIDID